MQPLFELQAHDSWGIHLLMCMWARSMRLRTTGRFTRRWLISDILPLRIVEWRRLRQLVCSEFAADAVHHFLCVLLRLNVSNGVKSTARRYAPTLSRLVRRLALLATREHVVQATDAIGGRLPTLYSYVDACRRVCTVAVSRGVKILLRWLFMYADNSNSRLWRVAVSTTSSDGDDRQLTVVAQSGKHTSMRLCGRVKVLRAWAIVGSANHMVVTDFIGFLGCPFTCRPLYDGDRCRHAGNTAEYSRPKSTNPNSRGQVQSRHPRMKDKCAMCVCLCTI